MLTPQQVDQRSLALHRLVAQKVSADPELFAIARSSLSAMIDGGKISLTYLAAWSAIFELGWQEAIDIATEESERGQTLRSCSPFAGILSEYERLDFHAHWRCMRDSSEQK